MVACFFTVDHHLNQCHYCSTADFLPNHSHHRRSRGAAVQSVLVRGSGYRFVVSWVPRCCFWGKGREGEGNGKEKEKGTGKGKEKGKEKGTGNGEGKVKVKGKEKRKGKGMLMLQC